MTFEDLDLIEPIRKALVQEGYTTPTPIQSEAIPIVLQGYDLLGCAQTGTGKTAAFSIPIIQRLYLQKKKGYRRGIKALILTPTRELAIQIGESFAAYGRFVGLRHTVIFGGVGQKPQTEALERGIDILIATPGRLLDLIGQGFIHLDTLEYFVLDEADRMLDMGFIHDIKRILPLLPKKRQSLFFSATMPPEIERLAGTILSEPRKVEVTPASSTVDAIDQSVYFVEKAEKINLLKSLLENPKLESVLIFTRTKHGADKVARVLSKAEIGAEAIHGNKSQTARQRALTNFKDHTTRVLIATDIAARGIDVDHLTHVINYELPNVPETYVHRIGRTGRAGREGVAFSFCDAEEVPLLKDIQKLIGKEVPVVGGHRYETKEVKAAVAEKKEVIKQESKRRNMFGSKRDGSYWRNKKRAAGSSVGSVKNNPGIRNKW
ncbi:DEAD/DEAH box helicase [Parabacteroides sp. ZJ-118]|uniref:DEAD/DEAH box helicase n=1 Tax=Parabacteroides sp. ZJ-118 TaxID=2709398 RepID=UPI0013EE377F|nr:DEAD/DEAH box helicase [Parabacteroides sp. ZJ-118]